MGDSWLQLVDAILQTVTALSVAYTAKMLRQVRSELKKERRLAADRAKEED